MPSSSASGMPTRRFLERNREFVAEVGDLEARVRRGHLLDDDAVHDFYDRARSGATSCRRAHFDRWWRDASTATPDLLELTADDLRDADGTVIRPRRLSRHVAAAASSTSRLSYRFAPGEPLDGVTAARAAHGAQPGRRGDARLADPRLPRRARASPRAHAAQGHPPRADPARRDGPGRRTSGSARHTAASSTPSPRRSPRSAASGSARDDFDTAAVPGPPADARARGRRAGQGARRRHGSGARSAPASPPRHARRSPTPSRSPSARGSSTWDLGTLPRVVETERGGHRVVGYPGAARRRRQRVAAHRDQRGPAAAGDARRGAPAAAAHGRAVGRRRRPPARRGRPSGDRRQRDLPRRARRRLSVRRGRRRPRRCSSCHGTRRPSSPCRVRCGHEAGRSPRRRSPAPPRVDGRRVVRASGSIASVARRVELVGDGRRGPPRPARRTTLRDRRRCRPPRATSGATSTASPTASTASPTTSSATYAGWARSCRSKRRYHAYLRRLGRSRPSPEAVEVRWLLEELRMSVFAQPLGVGERVSTRRVGERLTALGA